MKCQVPFPGREECVAQALFMFIYLIMVDLHISLIYHASAAHLCVYVR